MAMDSSALLSKYMNEKEGNSLKFMQRMLYLIFSEVVYQRELLPREHFTEKNILGCTLHVPNLSKDRRQMLLHTNLKGAANAVTDKKLKQYHLMVHSDRNDPAAASEVFIMDVVYSDEDDEASIRLSSPDLSEVRVRYSGVEELQKQTKHVFSCLRKGLSTLEPITRNVSFSFYITYRDGVNRSFHPAGYGQAAKMYVIPETAEIGDMGVLHAKEHACLLKLKSTMLEDGFQLMQRNAETQPTQSSSGTLSEESMDRMSEGGTSDKASTLGALQSHSEWEETPQKKKEERRDQRSIGEKSMESSQKTIQFGEGEEVSTRLDESMSSDDVSVELGIIDDFIPSPVFTPSANPSTAKDEMKRENITMSSDFASSEVTMVTKKLTAADERRKKEEVERKKVAKQPEATPSERSHSSIDGGSEASEEPPVTRRTSLRKRKSLPKVKEESTESDETLTENDELEVPQPQRQSKNDISSGREADTEPSDSMVVKKTETKGKKTVVVVERRRPARLSKGDEVREEENPSQSGRVTRSGRSAAEVVDTSSSESVEKKSGGKKKREKKTDTPVESSYNSSGETIGTNPGESGRVTRSGRSTAATVVDTDETPRRAPRGKKTAEIVEEVEKEQETGQMKTPGEAPKRARGSTQQ